MRILETGSRQAQKGLTLVEILVVIAIIGLFAGVVVLTLPKEKDQTETEAFRLARQLQAAQELSIMRKQITGLDISPNGYTFVGYEDGEWQALVSLEAKENSQDTQKEFLFEVQLENLVNPGTVGGERKMLLDDVQSDAVVRIEPEVIFQPTGEVTPLEIRIVGKKEVWKISQSRSAEILVQREDG